MVVCLKQYTRKYICSSKFKLNFKPSDPKSRISFPFFWEVAFPVPVLRSTISPFCDPGNYGATYVYDQKMKEKEKLIQLLVGLNDVYKGVRGNILMSKPLPNVSEAYYMLLQEEHQREMSSEVHIMPQSATLNSNLCTSNQESVGLLGKNVSSSTYTRKNGSHYSSYNGGHNTQGYSANGENHNRSLASRRPLFCDHCKMSGHTVQKCYKTHGYPPGHRLYRGKRVAASMTQD